MPWIAIDVNLAEHPKMLALPSDVARYGWVLTLCAAKRQKRPGQFASELHYGGVLHRHAKYLPDYCRVGLLERHEDGSLHVHDWQRYQWAATKARQREDRSETSEGHGEDSRAGNAVPVPVPVRSSTEGGPGEPLAALELSPALLLYEKLHGRIPGNWEVRELHSLVDHHDSENVSAAIEAEYQADSSLKSFLGRVRRRLEALGLERDRQAAQGREDAEVAYVQELAAKAAAMSPEERARVDVLRAEIGSRFGKPKSERGGMKRLGEVVA